MKKLAFSLIFLALSASALVYAQTNAPPVWNQISTQTIAVGQFFQIQVVAADSDPLIFTALSLPAGATFHPPSHTFTWTPLPSQLGGHQASFRVSDGNSSADMSFTIHVIDPSRTPTYPTPSLPTPTTLAPSLPVFVNFNPPTRAREGQMYTYTVQAVSNVPVTYRLITAPAGMTVSSAFGIIVWLPDFSQGRTEPYTVTVGAAAGPFETTKSYSITVEDVPPPEETPGAPLPRSSPMVRLTPTPTPIPLKISDLKFEKADGDVVISWTTNKPARSRVIYDTVSQADKKSDFSYKNATPDPSADELKTEHSIRLTDLKGGATYYFRAVSKRNGEIAVSEEMNFETEAEEMGLALVTTLKDFLTNPWLYAFLALFALIALYRRRQAKKQAVI